MTQNYDRFAEQFLDMLCDLGYTHCFYLAGGNVMHLLEAASHRFVCIPVVHELSAGIATEFFNELETDSKAFALVTAGPGLTNIITAMAGAFLESRELLVVGGQVKSSDLSDGSVRQIGIQEIDGLALTKSITKSRLRIQGPVSQSEVYETIIQGSTPKKGPVFIEITLDAQAMPRIEHWNRGVNSLQAVQATKIGSNPEFGQVAGLLSTASRPVLLIGGGVSRDFAWKNLESLSKLNIPIMTTWNGADRVPANQVNYFGRPNTWGQRYSNVLIQQSDLVIAVGTRLGLQQTGFNWQEFVPQGTIVQVDLDSGELNKGRPRVDLKIQCDADHFLESLLALDEVWIESPEKNDWLRFAQSVKSLLPLSEGSNGQLQNYLNPYDFFIKLSSELRAGDAITPSSSGSCFTVGLQSIQQTAKSYVVTSKSLASMGYGLAGAIGMAVATNQRVFLVEGDGGFAQNIQELGTVVSQNLNIKIFVFDNGGYASIRTTQRTYYDNHYLGCDRETGLGLPDWSGLFEAFGIPCRKIEAQGYFDDETIALLDGSGPVAFIVPIHVDQTYFPKIASRVTDSGSMESNPIHLMSPELPADLAAQVFKYI